MIRAAFMGKQNKARRYESLTPIRGQKIRTLANHFDGDQRGNRILPSRFCGLRWLYIVRHRPPFGNSRMSGRANGFLVLGRELVAATCAAGGQHFAASDSCFAGAETMAPFTDQAARLKCALHRVYPTSEMSIKKAAKSCGPVLSLRISVMPRKVKH